jgi:hypothetical protein
MKEELAGIERYRGPKERALDQYASSLEAMQTTKEGLESELHQVWHFYAFFISGCAHGVAWACNESLGSSFLDLRSVTVDIRRLKCMVWVAIPLVCQRFFFNFTSLQQLEINYIHFHIVSGVHS